MIFKISSSFYHIHLWWWWYCVAVILKTFKSQHSHVCCSISFSCFYIKRWWYDSHVCLNNDEQSQVKKVFSKRDGDDEEDYKRRWVERRWDDESIKSLMVWDYVVIFFLLKDYFFACVVSGKRTKKIKRNNMIQFSWLDVNVYFIWDHWKMKKEKNIQSSQYGWWYTTQKLYSFCDALLMMLFIHEKIFISHRVMFFFVNSLPYMKKKSFNL